MAQVTEDQETPAVVAPILQVQNEISVVENVSQRQDQINTDSGRKYSFYFCNICNEPYYNKHSFDRHRISKKHKLHQDKEEIKRYRCFCGKSFSHKSSLDRHQLKHLEEQPPKKSFKCKFCSKIFTESHNMARHIASIHEKKRYLCEVCGKDFSAESNLKLHCHKDHK